MDPRDPMNDRIRKFEPRADRQGGGNPAGPAPRKSRPPQPGRQPPSAPSPGPARGTGALRPVSSPAQDDGSPFRLDPNSPPGEFNFIVPQQAAAAVPQVGLIAEVDGPIPPQLYKAVDEVLGFIYGLDQQFENQGRRPKK